MTPAEMTPIWIALIVAIPTVLTSAILPLVLNIVTARARTAEKIADNKRQDELTTRTENAAKDVAIQAREAARLLVLNTSKVAEVAKETGDKIVVAAKVTNDKLDVLHTLVNSQYTAALQAELDATMRELVMVHEVIDLKRAQGQQPSEMSQATIAATEAKIAALHTTLDERAKQAKVVETQQANQRHDNEVAANGGVVQS